MNWRPTLEHNVPRDPPLTPNSILTLPRRAEYHSGPAADAHVPVLQYLPRTPSTRSNSWNLTGTAGAIHGSSHLPCNLPSDYRVARFPHQVFRGKRRPQGGTIVTLAKRWFLS